MKTKRISIRIDKDLYNAIEEMKETLNHDNISQTIRIILVGGIIRHKKNIKTLKSKIKHDRLVDVIGGNFYE